MIAHLAMGTTKGLRQGLFAQGMLRVGETQTLAIPLSAVRTDKPKPYIQIVRDKRIVHVAAELGATGEADGKWMVALTCRATGTPSRQCPRMLPAWQCFYPRQCRTESAGGCGWRGGEPGQKQHPTHDSRDTWCLATGQTGKL